MKAPSSFAIASRQSGISLVAAIFLLLLMAGLAAFMASIISATQINSAADVAGSRAYQAARAGVEWGMFQLDPNGSSSGLPSCAAATGNLTAIAGHAVTVSCQAYPSDTTFYQEGSRQVRIFRIVARATAVGVRPPGVEREVTVTIGKCRDPAQAVAPFDC